MVGRLVRQGVQSNRFSYKRPTYDDIEKRATQSQTIKDLYFKSDFDIFKTPEKDHCVRILPPSWEDAEHYGFIVYIHKGIGADKSDYLCLSKMKDISCPLCEERDVFQDDPEYADKLRVQKRYVVWLINRDDEEAGALLWSMAWSIDRDIARISKDKRTKDVFYIDDIQEGYDLNFEMKMQKSTKYSGPTFVGFQLARKSTPLFPDEDKIKKIEDFIAANPIPECLKYYDYDYMSKVFTPKKDEQKEELDQGDNVKDNDDIPYKTSDSKDVKEEKESKKEDLRDIQNELGIIKVKINTKSYTWDEIHKMESSELDDTVIEEKLFNEEELNAYPEGDEKLADLLCSRLGIDKPSSGRAKLKSLRDKKRS